MFFLRMISPHSKIFIILRIISNEPNMNTLNIILALSTIISTILAIHAYYTNFKEYDKATKRIKGYDIEGEWYSAELDLKKIPNDNAILTVKIKRKRWLNYNVTIDFVEQHENDNHEINTNWSAKGIVLDDNTLSLNWEGGISKNMRKGSCFMQFVDENIGVGFWMGYASKRPETPAYGYWILVRKQTKPTEKDTKAYEKLKRYAEIALKKFKFYDVREWILEDRAKGTI